MTWALCHWCESWRACLKVVDHTKDDWPTFICLECYWLHLASPQARKFMKQYGPRPKTE